VTPPPGGPRTYGHDALGHDAFGRPWTRTTGASIDTYAYLGSTTSVWQIANSGGGVGTTSSALDATGARTAISGAGARGYLAFDLHGNLVAAENGAKVITDALRYDAWGEVLANPVTSALPTPWRYQGRLDLSPDAANPLYDYGARTYRPVQGAFTSLDTYAGAVIDPLSMNRFLYAEANPTSFVDPDGHAACSGTGRHAGSGRSCTVASQAAADQAIEEQYIEGSKAGGAKRPTGSYQNGGACTFVRLDCSLADFDRMSVDDRIAWTNGLMDEYGGARNFTDWFNNVKGILDFASDNGLMQTGSWESWVDAGILQGITTGLGISLGKLSADQTSNPGAAAWAAFFDYRADPANHDDATSRLLWGTAEQTSTDYGVQYAEGTLGLAADPRIKTTLITFGNAYRAGVKDPAVAGYIGQEVGSRVGAGIGIATGATGGLACGLLFIVCSPVAGAIGGVGGWIVGGAAGSAWANDLLDPRQQAPAYAFSQLLYSDGADWLGIR